MATVSQLTPYTCTSLIFLGDEAIKRAITTRDGYIKRYYHARGEHVRKIQRVMALYYELEAGWAPSDVLVDVDPPGKGVFGRQTEMDLWNYQGYFKLLPASGRADGICGPQTLKHMDAYWRDNRPFHLGFDAITRQAF
ncbi:MAG: hypothetical protein EOO26_04320 [Comamonadaceae bacterium]|nr:MAG: hypothetical protein EOO26_04320 [Comamonadaceae bacterium]